MLAVASATCFVEASQAQIPIAVKELQIEKNPATLNAPVTITNDANGKSSSSQTVSDRCRDDYLQAKAQWAKEKKSGYLASFGCSFRRLHLGTSTAANEYFGNFEVGNAIALTYGDKQSTVYTELLSDNLWLSAGLGYARVGLSAQFAGSRGVADPGSVGAGSTAVGKDGGATVGQLFQGGGNASIHVTWPLFVWINFVGETDVDKTPVRRFDSFVTIATGLDIPELNAEVDSRSGNVRLGWQGIFTMRTFNEDFRFFAQGNTAYLLGFSDGFYNNLLGTDVKRPAAGLGLARATLGLELGKIARVGVSFGTTTMKGVTQPARLSVQLIDSR